MQIESYRKRLEEFEENLNRELYRYYSGLKDRLEIVSLYSDYSDIFSPDSIRETAAELENTSELFPSRRKSLSKLAGYLIDQYLDLKSAPLTQQAAEFETRQTVQWEGQEVPCSRVPDYLRNESDAVNRRRLGEKCAAVLSRSEELRLENIAQKRSAAVKIGYADYVRARERICGVDYGQLLSSVTSALKALDDLYMEHLRASVETSLGIPFQDAGAWDVAYWEKANDIEQVFSKRSLVPVAEAAISELGLTPEQADSITMDLELRAQKRIRPFCIPLRIPQEIKIVLVPESGSKYYLALLHESGHALHFAWTDSSLPFEHRRWGDRALSEAYGFLLEQLIRDRLWLARMLLFTKSSDFLRFQSLLRVFLIRRCAGRLEYAVKLHQQQSLEGMPRAYSEIMRAFTGLQHLPESWLDDFSDGFDSADYLRGWVLESMLRDNLKSKFGTSWDTNRAAANFLKEIWETGQLYTADELSREIGMGDLNPQVLADELAEGLKS
jgi:hypothetical protein